MGNAVQAHKINFNESGRGLNHAWPPTIFGSTVGYPSDSLASCITYLLWTFSVWNKTRFD